MTDVGWIVVAVLASCVLALVVEVGRLRSHMRHMASGCMAMMASIVVLDARQQQSLDAAAEAQRVVGAAKQRQEQR